MRTQRKPLFSQEQVSIRIYAFLGSKSLVQFSFHQHPIPGMRHCEAESALLCSMDIKGDFQAPEWKGSHYCHIQAAYSIALPSNQSWPKPVSQNLNRKQAHGSRRNNTCSAKSNTLLWQARVKSLAALRW